MACGSRGFGVPWRVFIFVPLARLLYNVVLMLEREGVLVYEKGLIPRNDIPVSTFDICALNLPLWPPASPKTSYTVLFAFSRIDLLSWFRPSIWLAVLTSALSVPYGGALTHYCSSLLLAIIYEESQFSGPRGLSQLAMGSVVLANLPQLLSLLIGSICPKVHRQTSSDPLQTCNDMVVIFADA